MKSTHPRSTSLRRPDLGVDEAFPLAVPAMQVVVSTPLLVGKNLIPWSSHARATRAQEHTCPRVATCPLWSGRPALRRCSGSAPPERQLKLPRRVPEPAPRASRRALKPEPWHSPLMSCLDDTACGGKKACSLQSFNRADTVGPCSASISGNRPVGFLAARHRSPHQAERVQCLPCWQIRKL